MCKNVVDHNDVLLTSNILNVLKEWQTIENIPAIYLEKLTGLQDFFCRMLINNVQSITTEEINQFLMDIVCIKDNIRAFDIRQDG